MTDRFYCSLASTARGETLAGTALPNTRFLVLEHAGPWQFSSRETLDDGSDAAARIQEWVAGGGRVQLARRPGSAPRRDGDVGMVLYASPEGMWRSSWRCLADVAALLSALPCGDATADEGDRATADDEGAGTGASTGASGTAVGAGSVGLARGIAASSDAAAPGAADGRWVRDDAARVFVCAHTRHDVCCAVLGRKVSAVLHQQWPERVWETSHLGGDRFAANALLLPTQVMVGRLTPDIAVDQVVLHEQGRCSGETTRGRCGQAPAVQRAIVEVVGALPEGEHVPVEVLGHETEAVDSADLAPNGDSWVAEHTVTLQVGPEVRVVVIGEGLSEPAQHTCSAKKPTQVRTLSVVPGAASQPHLV